MKVSEKNSRTYSTDNAHITACDAKAGVFVALHYSHCGQRNSCLLQLCWYCKIIEQVMQPPKFGEPTSYDKYSERPRLSSLHQIL